MRKLFATIILLAAGLSHANAQTNLVALPSPTQHQVDLSWTNACASTITCTFNVYRCTGSDSVCTATSSNWQLLTLTPISGTAYADMGVTASTTYSYEVYALATVSGQLETSAPSNETSATVPLGPAAPASASSVAQ